MNVTLALPPDLDARLARIEAMLAAMQPPDLVDATEAAKLLGVTPKNVRNMALAGKIPCVRVNGRIRIARRDVLAMLGG